MKRALCIMLLLCAGTAQAAGTLERDGASNPIQGFAPNGKKDAALTVNSVTYDMRGVAAWAHYGTTACKFRTMSTATKAGLQRTLPASTLNIRYVNSATPFLNLTGCTLGEFQRQ